MSQNAAPLSQNQRLLILDILRGIAVLGILMMNIPIFGNSYTAHYNINIFREFSGPDYWSWYVVNLLFEGTMRGIFSILFGAGALLLLDRLERNTYLGLNPADIFYRRQIWLFLFGMVNAFLFMWAGDILYVYGLTGLFLFPFRKMKAERLLFLGMLFLSFSTLQHMSRTEKAKEKREKGEAALHAQTMGKSLSHEQKEDLETWNEYQQEHSTEHLRAMVAEEQQTMRKSWMDVFRYLSPINQKLQSQDLYNEMFFDALAFFFIGMALFRMGFLTGALPLSTYFTVFFFSYAFGLTLSYLRLRFSILSGFDISRPEFGFSINIYQVRRLAMALGHISLILMLYKWFPGNLIFRWLARTGQMAFTNYLTQSLICTFLFFGYGFGYFGKWSRFEIYEAMGVIWIFQIIVSNIWLQYFRFGPFEWLWRSLTYWKKQPFLGSSNTE